MAQVNTVAHSLKWGIIATLSLVIFNIIIYILGFYHNWALGMLYLPIFFFFVLWAIKSYRDSNGTLSIGQGLLIGLSVGLLSGLFLGIYNYVLLTMIDPNLYIESTEAAVEMVIKMGGDEEMAEAIMDEAEKNPPSLLKNVLGSFAVQGFVGFIFALIPAFIYKREHASKY